MRNKTKLFILMGLLILVAFMPNKVKATDDGTFYYEENEDGVSVTITGIIDETSTDVTIPSTIGTKNVTSIGNAAFFRNKYITDVTIPDSVT